MERKSPRDVAEIKEKIDNGKVKVKGNKNKQNTAKTTNKAHGVKGVNGNISDAKIMAWLKKQDEHVTSTQIRDGLGFKSRTQVRRVLKRLAKLKKINIGRRKISDKRQIYTYDIA